MTEKAAPFAANSPEPATESSVRLFSELGFVLEAIEQAGDRKIRLHRCPFREVAPSRPPSQSGRTFLANHAQAIWATDLLVVKTLIFQTLYVLFFISHGRRQLVHFEVTAHPAAASVWRQLIEAKP